MCSVCKMYPSYFSLLSTMSAMVTSFWTLSFHVNAKSSARNLWLMMCRFSMWCYVQCSSSHHPVFVQLSVHLSHSWLYRNGLRHLQTFSYLSSWAHPALHSCNWNSSVGALNTPIAGKFHNFWTNISLSWNQYKIGLWLRLITNRTW